MAPVRRLAPPPRAEARRHDVQGPADVLAYMSFPAAHRTKLHSTNPIERLNGEMKRRTDVRRHLPQRAGDHPPGRRAMLLEQNDEWAVQRARAMTLETIAPLSEDSLAGLPAVAA